MNLSTADHVIAAVAALGAGFVNAVAGGGTLLSFPTLVALGVPSVRSNVTNTVALCPGYFGGTYAQRADLKATPERAKAVLLPSAVGGLFGSVLLVISPEKLFKNIVPFLILAACALLGFQDQIKKRLPPRPVDGDVTAKTSVPVRLSVLAASTYGGYFGAGMGIVLLAVLGIALPDSMRRINALKQLIAATTNIVAALFFVSSGKVVWSLALAMAPASLLGGQIGGRAVTKIPAKPLRAVVIAFGVAVAVKAWL